MGPEKESAAAEAEASSADEVQDFGAEWDKANEAAPGETGIGDEKTDEEKAAEAAAAEAENDGLTPEEIAAKEAEAAAEPAEPDEAAKLAEQQQKATDWKSTLLKVHPDADTHMADPKLQAWLDKQPQAVQDAALQIEDAAASAGVLTAFKADLAAGNVDEAAEADASDPAQWFKDHGLGDATMEVADDDGENKKISYAESLEYPGQKMSHDSLVKGLAAVEQRMTEKIEQRMGGIDAQKINADMGDFQLLRAHPDADKIGRTKKFTDYKAKQPAPFQKLWDSGDTDARIAFMTKFKTDSVKTVGKPDPAAALHASTMGGSSDGHVPADGGDGGGTFDSEWDEAKAKDK